MADSFWLICPNLVEVRCFTKNINIKDKINKYIFIDSGLVVGIYGEKPPLMKTRKVSKIEEARKEWQKLIKEGWQETSSKW